MNPTLARREAERPNDEEDTAGHHVRWGGDTGLARIRETMPKQFIALIGKRSTFRKRLRVADPIFAPPIVVTNHDYRFLVKEQLAEIGAETKIVIEPSRRDSGPAVAVAAVLAAERRLRSR